MISKDDIFESKNHPRKLIEEALSLTIKRRYRIDWRPSVTKPAKAIKDSRLKFIDYSSTCFELANRIGVGANEMACDLSQDLDKLQLASGQTLGQLEVEHVGGYINFQLAQDDILRSVQQTISWLQLGSPRASGKPQVKLWVRKTTANDKHNKKTGVAYRTIIEIYKISGYRVNSRWIIGDCSDHSIEVLSGLLASKELEFDPAKLEQSTSDFRKRQLIDPTVAGTKIKVRRYLSNGLKTTPSTSRLSAIHQQSISHISKSFDSDASNSQIVTQSEFSRAVHGWLDKAPASLSSGTGIVKDPASQASYYGFQTGLPVALRSASGLLHEPAYLIYELDKLLDLVKDDRPSVPMIFVVPQRFHQFLYEHAEFRVPNTSYKDFICIDPSRVYKSISQRGDFMTSVPRIFKKMAATLQTAVKAELYNSARGRREIMEFIDFPLGFYEKTSQLRPLELVSEIYAKEAAADKLTNQLKV